MIHIFNEIQAVEIRVGTLPIERLQRDQGNDEFGLKNLIS